ncbi:MAG: hypothetical protein IMZ50_04775 [Candidatus Atribacteria bacterium]|nr:hypothetical protein [Candidatus Atribacteria bacterium]
MKDVDAPQVKELLLFAPERVGISFPGEGIKESRYHLSIEAFGTRRRFNDYDGVVLFQGIFERFKEEHSWTGENEFSWHCEKDELDRRRKEANLLLQKGGFICFVLRRPFVDRLHEEDISHIDLAKIYLNYDHFFRKSFPNRVTSIQCKRSEFDRFLKIFGAASTTFTNHNDNLSIKPIATYRNDLVGMIIGDSLFFIPALLPAADNEHIKEFFSLLIDAVLATRNKLVSEIPEWATRFVLRDEDSLMSEKAAALRKVEDIDARLKQLEDFKTVLVRGDEGLVDSVAGVLNRGFGFKTNQIDELREDLKVLDDAGAVSVLCEIKGVNRGVTREYINQADNHRERAGLPASFPAILIINTNMKNSKNVQEKDQDIAVEQILHAKKMSVLILRTIDLLRLLRLFLANRIDKSQVLQLLSSGSGWLKVEDDKWELKEG